MRMSCIDMTVRDAVKDWMEREGWERDRRGRGGRREDGEGWEEREGEGGRKEEGW